MEGMEAMEDTVEAMEDMEATEATTTARGPLRLMPIPPPLLSPLLMPSPDMATTATALTDTAMLLLTPTDIIIMARGLLMPSPAMGITAMGTEATTEDTVATVATEDTTTVEKFQKFMLIQSD